MSSARRHESRPVVVEVRPDNADDISPRSRSPKVVHFAPTSAGMVTGISRELTATEAWSLYHFEHHAKYCTACHDPYKSFKRTKTGTLCATGLALAQDAVYHVRYIDGEIYSTATDAGQLVRVEVPPKYDNLRSLVKAVARGMRVHRAAPAVVHHAYAHPLTPPRTPDPEEAEHAHDLFSSSPRRRHATVIVEPASSDASRRSAAHRHSYHHETRYPRVVVTEPSTRDEEAAAAAATASHRRGTLYEQDLQRSQERYRTEIREPSPSARLTLAHQQQQQHHHRRHREEQRQTVYFS